MGRHAKELSPFDTSYQRLGRGAAIVRAFDEYHMLGLAASNQQTAATLYGEWATRYFCALGVSPVELACLGETLIEMSRELEGTMSELGDPITSILDPCRQFRSENERGDL